MAHLSASSEVLLPPSGKTCINAAFTYIVLKLHYFDSTDSNKALIYSNLMDVLVNKCLLTHPAEKTYFFLSECFLPSHTVCSFSAFFTRHTIVFSLILFVLSRKLVVRVVWSL